MTRPIVKRPLERHAKCRGCDAGIDKGAEVVYTYSGRNRGQHIYFCLPCARHIGELATESDR